MGVIFEPGDVRVILCKIVEVNLDTLTVKVQTLNNEVFNNIPIYPIYYSSLTGTCALLIPEKGATGLLMDTGQHRQKYFVGYASLFDMAAESYFSELPIDDVSEGDFIIINSSGTLLRIKPSDVIELSTGIGLALLELIGRSGLARLSSEKFEIRTPALTLLAGPSKPIETPTGYKPLAVTIYLTRSSDPNQTPFMQIELGDTTKPNYIAVLELLVGVFNLYLKETGELKAQIKKLEAELEEFKVKSEKIELGAKAMEQLVTKSGLKTLLDAYNAHSHGEHGVAPQITIEQIKLTEDTKAS